MIIGVGTGSILFDGLSQTEPWFAIFGAPGRAGRRRSSCSASSASSSWPPLAVARLVGVSATGAGLLPIAAGYLIAHYFTYLLIDGQRIIVAIADPLQQGSDLGGFGWAFFEPNASFLPPGLVWTIQIAAVVGGHMLGAWAGHVVYMADPAHAAGLGRRARGPARGDHGRADDADAVVARPDAGRRGRGRPGERRRRGGARSRAPALGARAAPGSARMSSNSTTPGPVSRAAGVTPPV